MTVYYLYALSINRHHNAVDATPIHFSVEWRSQNKSPKESDTRPHRAAQGSINVFARWRQCAFQLKRGSFGHAGLSPSASRSVQAFLQCSLLWRTHRQTHMQTTSLVFHNRPFPYFPSTTRAFQFAIRIDSIRYANRFESIPFCKKSAFRFTSCHAGFALNK